MKIATHLTLINVIIATFGAVMPRAALADGFSFAGNFHQDDEQRTFTITMSNPGNMTVRTLSYAGGTASDGTSVPAGGFDPTLSIFDSSGTLIALNRDAGCGSPADPITLLCWDSAISIPLPAGSYQIVLTESDNVPIGETLDAGFLYDGNGNFTADPESATSDGFWDLSLHHRTSAYVVDVSGVNTAQLGLTPKVSSLTNSASSMPGHVAPNDILSYYDPALLGGPVTVSVNGEAATVLYSGTGQLNLVMPGDLVPGSTVTLQISRGNAVLLAAPFTVSAADPALFALNAQGTGQGAVLNDDYSVNGPARPAKAGSYLVIYGTGFGAVSQPGADGLSRLTSGVTATIGGKFAEVTYAGLVPGETPGLQQINVHLPDDAPTGSAVPIQLTIGGVTTQAGVTVAIQ
ncbi:MAG TPA: DVUA0089 family protein [Bryobacteraceae bacterium]|nr:DVUA0089 family protein [Bryobacteraceae bacterium]